jgi:hypothetical protein
MTFEADELHSMQRLWNNPENLAADTEIESGGDPLQHDGPDS